MKHWARWEDLPSDPSDHPDFIDHVLRNTLSEHILGIFNGRPRRDIDFQSPNYRRDVDLDLWAKKYAGAIQQRGDLSEIPCDCCKYNEKRPFTLCIRIEDEQFG